MDGRGGGAPFSSVMTGMTLFENRICHISVNFHVRERRNEKTRRIIYRFSRSFSLECGMNGSLKRKCDSAEV